MLKRLALAILLIGAATGGARAQSSYQAKDAIGINRTFAAFACNNQICSMAVPADATGNAFGVSANPFFVAPSPAATFPVSAAALPLPAGAATALKQAAPGLSGAPSADVTTVQGAPGMTPVKVDGSGATQPISVASLPLPAGAATQATLASVLSTLGTPFQAGGTIGNTAFGATQSGAWNVGIAGALPAFATTPSFKVQDSSTGALATVKPASTAAAAIDPSLVSNESPNSQLSQAAGTTADSAYAGSGNASIVAALKGLYAKLTSNPAQESGGNLAAIAASVGGTLKSAPPSFASPVQTSVAAAVADTQLLASNASRRPGSVVVNDSTTATLYVKLGSGASATSYWVAIAPSTSGVPGLAVLPDGYTGAVDGYWSAASGAARMTEMQ